MHISPSEYEGSYRAALVARSPEVPVGSPSYGVAKDGYRFTGLGFQAITGSLRRIVIVYLSPHNKPL